MSSRGYGEPMPKRRKSEAQQLVSFLMHLVPAVQAMISDMYESPQKEEEAACERNPGSDGSDITSHGVTAAKKHFCCSG